MIIWRQKFLPLTGHKAVFLAGILFVRKEAKMNERDLNHERIHSRQFTELMFMSLVLTIPLVLVSWWIPILSPLAFYVWYVVEWIIRLFAFKGGHHAYKNISFEREAYSHEAEAEYIKNRKRFAFTLYIREKKV